MSMIIDERISSYIQSLEQNNSEICIEIEKEAIRTNVPIIRKEMESFLKVMLLIKKPKRILELGTAIGYSAILMSNYTNGTALIDTVENYEKRIPIARNNIKNANREDVINIIQGDALEVMKSLKEKYDFIFMDAAKAQYINYLPEVTRLLNKDGILISDNVLQEGEIIESKFAVVRRNRTIHQRLREYMYELKHSKDYETSIVPIGDGITMSIKISD